MAVDSHAGLKPIHDGHIYVQQNNLEVVHRLCAHHLNGLKSIFRACNLKVPRQLVLVRHSDELIIIH